GGSGERGSGAPRPGAARTCAAPTPGGPCWNAVTPPAVPPNYAARFMMKRPAGPTTSFRRVTARERWLHNHAAHLAGAGDEVRLRLARRATAPGAARRVVRRRDVGRQPRLLPLRSGPGDPGSPSGFRPRAAAGESDWWPCPR